MRYLAFKNSFVIGFICVSIVGAFFLEPIAQDPNYHLFADTRMWGVIPNAADVLSNVVFIFVGLAGLWSSFLKQPQGHLSNLRWIYRILFIGIFLTGLGSGYYHWAPNNSTLVWDRIPMTIAFMALFAMIIGEQISEELALTIFGPVIVLGIFSVAYWHFTEQKGIGDLRMYALVQFLPLLLIPLLLLLYPSPFKSNGSIWLALGFYALSKGFEYYDRAIFELGFGFSGHSIKHISAAVGTGCVLWATKHRQLLN